MFLIKLQYILTIILLLSPKRTLLHPLTTTCFYNSTCLHSTSPNPFIPLPLNYLYTSTKQVNLNETPLFFPNQISHICSDNVTECNILLPSYNSIPSNINTIYIITISSFLIIIILYIVIYVLIGIHFNKNILDFYKNKLQNRLYSNIENKRSDSVINEITSSVHTDKTINENDLEILDSKRGKKKITLLYDQPKITEVNDEYVTELSEEQKKTEGNYENNLVETYKGDIEDKAEQQTLSKKGMKIRSGIMNNPVRDMFMSPKKKMSKQEITVLKEEVNYDK